VRDLFVLVTLPCSQLFMFMLPHFLPSVLDYAPH
jgi:hypothetical protein